MADSKFKTNTKYYVDNGIDLKQLVYFIAVVDHMSFSKAASELYVSQPLLSQRISDLEKKLGCQLLLRKHGGLSLTDAGESFVEKAMEIIALTNSLAFTVHRAASTSKPDGKLTVALDNLLPDELLFRAVQKFKIDYPRIVFEISCCTTKEVLEALEKGSVNLGITLDVPRRMKNNLVEELLGQTPLSFIASNRILRGNNLEDFIYVADRFPTHVLKDDNCCINSIMQVYGQLNIAPDFFFNNNLQEMILTVQCGMGVMVLPAAELHPEWTSRGLATFSLEKLMNSKVAVKGFWGSEQRNEYTDAFLECLKLSLQR